MKFSILQKCFFNIKLISSFEFKLSISSNQDAISSKVPSHHPQHHQNGENALLYTETRNRKPNGNKKRSRLRHRRTKFITHAQYKF